MKPLDGLVSSPIVAHRKGARDLDASMLPSSQTLAAENRVASAERMPRKAALADNIGGAAVVMQRPADHHEPLAWRRAQLKWLDRIAAATSSRVALDDALCLVRDAVVSACGFDRAGIFLYHRGPGLLQGVWGTDSQSKPVDISHLQIPVTMHDPVPICRIVRGELAYYLTCDHTDRHQLPPNDSMYGVRAHAQVPMCGNGLVVGVLCVDNLMSNRPITEEELQDLMPFARQAALAVCMSALVDEVSSARETMVRTAKLRDIGELASGVAHNFNNVLAAVQGYAELIQDAPGVPAEIGHYARIIERAVQDGAAMVRRIQHFARPDSEACALPLELSHVAREVIDLTRPAWHNQAQSHGIKIVVVTDLTPGLQVMGVDSEIREVMVNLIKNAVDAMPAGGTVTVRCYAERHDCVFTVADTGTGMSQETCRHIFEPFFTTKTNGRGTGLGLSVAWGIIARHDGSVRVESEVGRGTTFMIRLPGIERATNAEAVRRHKRGLNGLRVLLVEDEELVAGGIARVLAANGGFPVLAQDAEEALVWLEANANACDIVLSDHGLTGCTGLDLLARVRTCYPRLGRVLLSGWGARLPGVSDTSAAELVLAKPIRQDRLIAALLSLQNGCRV